MRKFLFTLGLALLAVSLFLEAGKPKPAISFENTIARSGIRFIADNSKTPAKHQIETMLSGVAVFDYNNDGFPDIFFANGARIPGFDKADPRFFNRLYRNNGDGTFTDVTEKAGVRGKGYSMGVAAGDYDNDGFEDLYVTGVDYNQLLHNNGDGTFADVTEKAGVAGLLRGYGKPWSISAGWFDYDNDGKLDLLVVNYVKIPAREPVCEVDGIRSYCAPSSFAGLPDMLFHNNGDGTFTDVSERSGIGKEIGKGMGVAFADYDGDGYADIFVANDTFRNFLFHNNRNGTFTETGILDGIAYNEDGRSIAGMGADFRDVDNDGRPDIFVTGMNGDTFPLFHNDGIGFSDITTKSGVGKASLHRTAWGNGIADFDNDGYKDLFTANGAILDNEEKVDHLPSRQPNLLLRNLRNGTFTDISAEAGPDFAVPRAHRGVAFGDFNDDGRMDAVVTVLNDAPELLMNRSDNRNHWLLLNLVGTRGNRDALGAKVKVTAGGLTQYNHVTTAEGLGGSSDKRVHFGLGSVAIADKIEITWPDGTRQVLSGVKSDRILTIRESTK